MAQPMSAAFRAGGVVDPVPGHGHHMAPPLLKGLDDAHLVLRGHPGVDGEGLDLLLQGLLGEEVQPRPVDGLVPRPVDVQLLGDGHGGVLVVPGDHHRADARPAHRSTACRTSGRGGSIMPMRPTKVSSASRLSAAMDLGRAGCSAGPPPAPAGARPARSPPTWAIRRRSPSVRGGGPGPQQVGAPGQHRLRGSLHRHQGLPIGQGVAGGHPFADRVKGPPPGGGMSRSRAAFSRPAWAAAWAMAVSVGSPM